MVSSLHLENRERVYGSMMTYAKFQQKKYAVIVFRHGRSRDNSIIYAILYLNGNIPEYICLGYSYISADGEYRGKFISYQTFEQLYSAREDIFEDMIYTPDPYELWSEYIPNTDGVICKGLDEYIANSRLPFRLYSLTLSHIYSSKIAPEIGKSHINKNYLELIAPRNEAESKQAFSTLKSIFTSTVTVRSDNKPVINSCGLTGQKYTIMTARELAEFGNIRHPIWLQVYCNTIISDLLLNRVCIGAPLYLGWFILPFSIGMFDNPAMLNKIKKSEQFKKITGFMRNVHQDTNVYQTFANALEDPITVAESRIILSDYVVCEVSEYVGLTIGNYIKLDMLEHGDIYSNIDFLARYMFDICYSLYCFNSILGIMQGDLHLNNCTLNNIVRVPRTLSVQYEIGRDVYTFPDLLSSGCVIDFSRAILREPPPNVDITADDIRENMRDFILAMIIRHFPEMSPSRAQIEAGILTHTDTVFRLLTVYDIWMMSSQLHEALKKSTNHEVSGPCLALLVELRDSARVYIGKLAEVNTNPDVLEPDEWPMHSILKSVFVRYTADSGFDWLTDETGKPVKSVKKADIQMRIKYHSDLRYSMSLGKYPPIVEAVMRRYIPESENTPDVFERRANDVKAEFESVKKLSDLVALPDVARFKLLDTSVEAANSGKSPKN